MKYMVKVLKKTKRYRVLWKENVQYIQSKSFIELNNFYCSRLSGEVEDEAVS